MHSLFVLGIGAIAVTTPVAARAYETTSAAFRTFAAVAIAAQVRQDTTARDTTAQHLGRVVITEKAGKRSGYAERRSTTALKTDTPLIDTPQSVTVVSRRLIADQS